jgi:hypothetical protein
MFSGSIIDDSKSKNVVRIKTVSDATAWSVTYDPHSDAHNIFIKQVTGHILNLLRS